MKTIHELKNERQEKTNQLITDCHVFFAFSNEQFAENKTPLQEGEKYVSMGMGGYIPRSQVAKFNAGMKEIDKWYKAAVKDHKLRRENIIYELSNHEAWGTGELEDTLDALGNDYTIEEIRQVYNAEYNKQMALRD